MALYILFLISFALSCMSLALCIVYRIGHKVAWTGYVIVLQSVLCASIFLLAFLALFQSQSSSTLINIISIVIKIIAVGCMGFVIVFLPYFLSVLIATPWRVFPEKIIFFVLGISYTVLGTVIAIVPSLERFRFLLTVFFAGMYLYCIVLLWTNLKNIDNKNVRVVCLVVNIVSLSLIPLSVLGQFFDIVEQYSYPIYAMAFSIIVVSDYYVGFSHEVKTREKKKELTEESLDSYKISPREFTVLSNVLDGLTNREISEKLGISVNTVNNHVANIFSKCNVRSRIDLINFINDEILG